MFAREIHKETFFLSYFCMTKSTKSHIRERSPLLYISSRVHELVARAMRGKCVRHRIKQKSVVSRSPQLHLYHACEHITRKSRADSCTHCLHARIYRCGGRGSDTYADGTIKITLISLCSHPDPRHYFDHPVSATPTAFACANRSIPARFTVA